jgi:hypothetical protein
MLEEISEIQPNLAFAEVSIDYHFDFPQFADGFLHGQSGALVPFLELDGFGCISITVG